MRHSVHTHDTLHLLTLVLLAKFSVRTKLIFPRIAAFYTEICKVVFCRVRTNRTRGSYSGYYPINNFCKFCGAFIPVPRTSGSSVRHSYPYAEALEVLYARGHITRGTGTASVVPARNFCEFCTPVPQYPELLEVL